MDVYKSFHDFLRLLYAIFLVPLFSILAWFIDRGYLLKRAPTYGKRVKSSDLKCGRFLGEGRSGIIYEATWSRGRDISLLARKAFPAVPADVFEYEAARLVGLHHRNIVKVLAWTVDRRSCSLVMDRMKYDLFSVVEKRKEAMRYDLFSVVEKRKEAMRYGVKVNFRTSTVPIPLREAVHVMLEIAEGMKYVHDQGLAHGDLKPNNVLVDSESGLMVVKVADYGLVETKKRSTTLVSRQARCLQILKWKAPELFEDLLGSSTKDSEYMWTETFPDFEFMKTSPASRSVTIGSADSRMQLADVYSFALTCSYVLGAQVPHDSNLGLFELRNEISSGERPHLPPECPKMLASLISECWDPIPSRRPAVTDICKKMRAVDWELIQNEVNMEMGWSEELSTDTWISKYQRISDEYQDPGKKLERLRARHQWVHFFFDFHESGLQMKKKFAEGARVRVHEGKWKRDDGKIHSVAIKIFKDRDFAISTPVMYLFTSKGGAEANLGTSRVLRPLGGTVLKDESLALVYERFWGDLRKLIDLQMLKNKDIGLKPPFKQEMAIDIMLQIAEGVAELHEFGVVHRDVKSMNVLVHDLEKFSVGGISCALTGYEAPEGILGTGFWRAPEILNSIKMYDLSKMGLITPAMDVYSYGMTCYEILTGKIPFRDESLINYEIVLGGGRPELPASVHPQLRDLVERCWHGDPSKRPTSQEIVLLLKNIPTGK